MSDLTLFVELFALIMLGFVLCFVGLSDWGGTPPPLAAPEVQSAVAALNDELVPEVTAEPLRRFLKASHGEHNRPLTAPPWQKSVIACFWAIFGEVEIDHFDAHVPLGQPVLFLYTVVMSIVLVNLLIAMFTETYQKVMHKSEIEYKFQMCNQIFIYKNVAQAIPPPFNLALVLPQLIGEFCCSCGGLTSAGSRRRRNLTAVGPREGTASDDNHANHVAASMFVEQYLQTVEEEEQASQHGLSVATHNAARHLERGQAEHADLLLDMQAQLKKMGSAMAEMSEKRDEIPAWAHAMNEGLSELKAQMAHMAARAKPAPVEASPAETTRERGETTLFARSPAAGQSSAAQEPAAPPTAQQQDPGSRRSMLQSVEGASVRRWV